MTDHDTWRRVCPDITDDEIAALDGLPASNGVGPQLLNAYRAGRERGHPTCAGLQLDQYVTVRMPDDSTIVGKVKYMAGVDGGAIVVREGWTGGPLGHQNLRIGPQLGSTPPPRRHVSHVDTPDGAVRFLVDLGRDRHVAETRHPRADEPENVTGPRLAGEL